MNPFRNAIAIAALIVTSLDFFHHFVTLSHGWYTVSRFVFLSFGLSAAIAGGALIAHVLFSLWNGTSFLKDLVDFES